MKPAKVLIWHFARKLVSFDCHEVAERTGCNLSEVQSYIKYLKDNNHVEQLSEAKNGSKDRSLYRVTSNCYLPPNDDKRYGRDRLWVSMRVMKRFTVSDLCGTAEVTTDVAHSFLATLLKYSVVKIFPHHNSNAVGRFKVYRLANDLGPGTPVLLRDGRVLDSNTGNYLEVKA
jgi:hypothetical protein